MNFIGMDIHKKFTVAVAKDEQGNELAKDKFENSKETFADFLKQFPSENTKIVIESTCVWEYIFELLEEMNYNVKLATKTLGKKALKMLTENINESEIFEHYINLLWYHRQELSFVEDKIRKIADENKDAKLLMTIPGIAEIRAMEIIAEIGEINRFQTAEKLCSYAGLVPSIKQSGDSLKFGKLVKQSNNILKHNLVEASWSIVRTKKDNQLKRFYKKIAKKKGKQKAICATARKMCCIIHAMLRKNQEFIIL